MVYQRKVHHRDEKCLNCDYPIVGDYCAKCGQKAHLHKDSVRHMLLHFVGDYFHYDNKFWTTIKTLLWKPGQITLDYNQGKRARYLNPIQLYIFITTVFFILFYGILPKDAESPIKINDPQKEVNTRIASDSSTNALKDSLQQNIAKPDGDSMAQQDDAYEIGYAAGQTAKQILKQQTLAEYDSIQNILPSAKKDGWFKRLFSRRMIRARELSYKDPNFEMHLMERMLHNTPKMFFILLPFFAFLLWLVYNKKRFYYVDHIIFSIHFHSLWFLVLTLLLLLYKIKPNVDMGGILFLLFTFGIGIYLYLSLLKVYASGSIKTLFKQLFIFFFYFFGFLISAILIVSISFMNA